MFDRLIITSTEAAVEAPELQRQWQRRLQQLRYLVSVLMIDGDTFSEQWGGSNDG